jgi:hypothetical protein
MKQSKAKLQQLEKHIIVLFVETPRKFTAVINLLVFPQTKLLYILSPCKHTKNL